MSLFERFGRIFGWCNHDDELIDKTTRSILRAVDSTAVPGMFTNTPCYETEEVVLVLKCKRCGRIRTIVE